MTEPVAIISDIHGNLEALRAVLADIQNRDITEIVCLGDVIGYGPNPKECLDLARERVRVCLLGNHEEATLNQTRSHDFNPRATKAVNWTIEQFDLLGPDKEKNAARWDYMGDMPETHDLNGCVCVHASPRHPTREYIYTRDIHKPRKLQRIFARFEHVCFVGHTHVPGVWTEDLRFASPPDLDYVYRLDERKTIINVGSVGQPRDLDPRACYVTFDGDTVAFCRVKYEYAQTIQKIYMIPELDDFLGDRLRRGR